MEIFLHRGEELGREARVLPAEIYNTARLIFAQQKEASVFVPIRNVQYLAIIDESEITFVHGESRNQIDVAWSQFHPQTRASLNDPVPYVSCYYNEAGKQIKHRLQSEFAQALKQLYGQLHASDEELASVLNFPSQTKD